jgi:hypothetical protein
MEHDLLTEVRTFLAQHDMSRSRFGRLAVNDHKIVWQIESGRRIWPETETRIRAFMAGYAAPGAPVGGAVDASTLSSDVRKVREAFTAPSSEAA